MKKEFRSSVRPQTQRLPTLPEDVAEGETSRYTLLEQTLKELSTSEDEDQEMLDVHDTEHGKGSLGADNGSDSGSATAKDETMDLMEGTPDSSGVRQEGWNAINNIVAPAGTGHTAPGASAAHQTAPITSSNAPASSPQGQPSGLHHQLLAASTGASPLVQNAPTAAAPPPYPHASQAQYQLQPQQPSGPPVQQVAALWSEEAKSRWLSSLDVHFSGDDLAAFVDGTGCEDWAAAARQHGLGGWLSAVWASGVGGTAGA